MDPLLSIDQVAEAFSVSPSTVRRWLRSGKLVGRKAGGQWRFDPTAVRDAFERGDLGGDGTDSIPETKPSAPAVLPGLISTTLARWGRFLTASLERVQPDHVVVNDRRGAKIWSLIGSDRFSWGINLWHSTAIRLWPPADLRRMFDGKKVLLFDELMQHGREMSELRRLLEDAGAKVTSVVCVRRRSHAEAGELLEYEATACDDVDNSEFTERAATISKLLSVFEPPLDVDHLVIRARLRKEVDGERFFQRIAEWGIPLLVWHPDGAHRFLAVSLDRPQFFDTAGVDLLTDFRVDWRGPCKIRFYINTDTRECFCTFIVFPTIEAPRSTWVQASSAAATAKSLRVIGRHTRSASAHTGTFVFRRVYWTACMQLAWQLLSDFIMSGAAAESGLEFDPDSGVDMGQLHATFGPELGETIAARTKDVLSKAKASTAAADASAYSAVPPPLLARPASTTAKDVDVFACRAEFLRSVPLRYAHSADQSVSRAISYAELLDVLAKYSSVTVGQVLDYELDRGTTKPAVDVEPFVKDNTEWVRVFRGFHRGEFGVWFEWDRVELTDLDSALQRTLGVCPTVVDQFVQRASRPALTATHFAKLFANLQHDWPRVFEPLYLGWRPYKYGPVPVVPTPLGTQEHLPLAKFLLDVGCIAETPNKHGTKMWKSYTVAGEEKVPWRTLYAKRTTAVMRAHISGLTRLYAQVQRECKTTRTSTGSTDDLALFSDPLVVLGAARNERIAYISGWFEVVDWREKGTTTLFPLMSAHAGVGVRPPSAVLKEVAESFAAPARLLHDKLEMYRHLPFLAKQIQELANRPGFEAAEIVLESVDLEPRWDTQSKYPVGNLEWASRVMRSFSSLVRQILTVCGLDEDRRRRGDGVKDARVYVDELLDVCPELTPFRERLGSAIDVSTSGKLVSSAADTLARAFSIIVEQFQSPGRLPDPRPDSDRERERLGAWNGLVKHLYEVPLEPPYAVAIADIRNLRNIPKLGEIFGTSYDEALLELLLWVERIAKEVESEFKGVRLCGLSGDNVVFAARNAVEGLSASLALIRKTSRRLSDIERSIGWFGLLRTGIAWREDGLGKEFQGLRPGFTAYEIGDRPGRPWGTIAITDAVFQRLDLVEQASFATADEACTQGAVHKRLWNPDVDGK